MPWGVEPSGRKLRLLSRTPEKRLSAASTEATLVVVASTQKVERRPDVSQDILALVRQVRGPTAVNRAPDFLQRPNLVGAGDVSIAAHRRHSWARTPVAVHR